QVSMPTKCWTPACGSSASGAIPTRAGISSSLSPAISLPIRLRNAPSCKRPTSPDGSCAAVSFIRSPQRDVHNAAVRSRARGLKPDYPVAVEVSQACVRRLGAVHPTDVRFAPKADKEDDIALSPLRAKSGLMHCNKTVSLFDHLVGPAEQRERESDAE